MTVKHFECKECEHWIRSVDGNEIGHGLACSKRKDKK